MKIKIFSAGIVFAVAVLFFPVEARAGNVVTNISGGEDIFDEDNVYPGWAEEHIVTVKNASPNAGEKVDIYFNFNVTSGSTLADQLRLYVIRDDDEKYRIGGAGDRMSLEEADGEGELYVDRLDFEEEEDYKVKIRFDKDAGNEFQNLDTSFDIDFSVTSETAASTEEEILLAQGRTVSGAIPPEEVLGQQASEEQEEQPEGETLGEEKPVEPEIPWWNHWYWAFPAGAILLGSYWMLRRKRIKIEEGPEI